MINSHRASAHAPEVGGFTLLEITIVLFILGLLIAAAVGPLQRQLEARDRRTTLRLLETSSEALYGFAATYGRLPCPDTTGDGRSDPNFDPANLSTAVCVDANGGPLNAEGFLPWAELGIAATDAWGRRLRYRVHHPHFTRPDQDALCNGASTQEFDLCAQGDIVIRTRGDDATTAATEYKIPTLIADHVPAVIVSHGANGYGGVRSDNTSMDAPNGDDEAENSDGDRVFFSRPYTGGDDSCSDISESKPFCEFDDLLAWLSPAILNNRMVLSGKLP